MRAKHRGWVAAVLIAGLLIAGGPGRAWATDFTWSGNGDPNNSGNWSDPNNWTNASSYPGGGLPGADNATIPGATAGRTVTADVAVVVNNLTVPASTVINTLRLNADMTVTGVYSVAGGNPSVNTININGYTLTLHGNPSAGQSAIFAGPGRIVKQGTSTLHLGHNNATHSFSGEIIVSNGVAWSGNYEGYFPNCTNVTVTSSGGVSGTFQFNIGATPNYLPQRFTIAGPGYNNQGALRWTQGNTAGNAFTRPIIVQSDATVSIGSGLTVEYNSTLSGNGALTLIGGGHLKIMNGLATHDGMIVVSNGTLSVPGALLSVTNITIEATGTLNGSQARFPNATVVNNGGTWNAVDTASTWSGLGDGSNWWDTANWFGAVPVEIEAIIPAGSGNIRVDAPAHVSKLSWSGGTITLDAELTVDQLDAPASVTLNVNGQTFNVDWNSDRFRTARYSGSGHIVKQGTGTFLFGGDNTSHPFSGSIVVSNGILRHESYWGYLQNVTNLMAGADGTYQFSLGAQPNITPQRFTINGPGYNNLGALRCLGTISLTRPITVQSDATTFINTGVTLTHRSTLGGSGTLTLIGGGHLDIMTGTSTHNGMIVVSNGTLSVPGALLSVTNITIEATGTLNGSQSRFPNATVVNNGGTWNAVDTASTWSGLGDGTNWWDTANWFGAVPVEIEAIIPAGSGNIRVDAPAHVSKLSQSGGTITLDADLTVGEWALGGTLNVNGQTFYVDWNHSQFTTPTFSGAGRIVKQGTGTFHLGPHNVNNPFSGSIVVSNGIAELNSYNGTYSSCTNLTVTSSAGVSGTFRFNGGASQMPQRFTINGPGYNNLGALRCLGTISLARPITVQSDATTFINTGVTLTHGGAFGGSGVLTLTGGGTYTMNNAWTYTVNGATGNGIVASNGTVNIAGCTLTIEGLDTATASEYVLVDYSSANGTLVGDEFANVIGLTGKWEIAYAGTKANPDAVVLVLPSPAGTVVMFR